MLIDAGKGFLGQVGGVLFILQGANEVIEKFRRVAFHQDIQGRVMAGGQTRHFLNILLVAGFHR
jgi:hypothetical protein